MLAAARQPRVVVDVEITVQDGTWERSWSGPNDHKEIVQIGAVKIDPETFDILERFDVLVRPKLVPQLSALFTRLTGITQEMVDRDGLPFPAAYAQFAAFRGDLPIHSYGGSRFGGDTTVFAENFAIHGIEKPAHWPSAKFALGKPLIWSSESLSLNRRMAAFSTVWAYWAAGRQNEARFQWNRVLTYRDAPGLENLSPETLSIDELRAKIERGPTVQISAERHELQN